MSTPSSRFYQVARSRPGFAVVSILAVIALWVLLVSSNTVSIPNLPTIGRSSTPDLHDKAVESFVRTAVHNATLGFGATILISLESRTDRRDSLALIAAAQGIRITATINAVRGEEIAAKAKPDGKAQGTLDDVHWGSWRSHMNALKLVVETGVETALIIEDDVDWDIYIKDQLHAFAVGLRASRLRAPWSAHEITTAPYGLDWDVLHLGPSKIDTAPAPLNALHSMYRDTNADPQTACSATASVKAWYCWRELLRAYAAPADARVILPSYKPLGLVALAVTQAGARRLLYELALRRLDTGLDWSIRDLLVAGRAQGWTVVPPLFSSWKTGGGADSDVNGGVQRLGRKKGGAASPGLAWSARLEVQRAMEEAAGERLGYWSRERWAAVLEDLEAPGEVDE